MSLIKWTLAMAGTAIGLRYMSDRHRRRMAEDNAPIPRPAQTDRDSETPWSASAGAGASSVGGTRSGDAQYTPGTPGTPSSTADGNDLQSPDDGLTPGSSANRF